MKYDTWRNITGLNNLSNQIYLSDDKRNLADLFDVLTSVHFFTVKRAFQANTLVSNFQRDVVALAPADIRGVHQKKF